MASRKLSDLRPEVEAKARAWQAGCREAGLDTLIYCTLRSSREQAELFGLGRTQADIDEGVAGLRGRGYHALADELAVFASPQPYQLKRTWALPGESAHQYGLAFDAVPVVGGQLVWSSKSSYWLTMGRVAHAVGLEWGGNWPEKKRDRPHFQNLLGKRIADWMSEATA